MAIYYLIVKGVNPTDAELEMYGELPGWVDRVVENDLIMAADNVREFLQLGAAFLDSGYQLEVEVQACRGNKCSCVSGSASCGCP